MSTPVLDGTSCSDGNACNGGESCVAGACTAGAPLRCNDNNPCTTDSCDPERGCVFSPVADGTSCADGNACNGAELCRQGVCQAGAPLVCADGNACTADTCDPARGCVQTAVSCDDGNSCTTDACDPVKGCANECLPNRSACGAGGVGTCVDCKCLTPDVTGSLACSSTDAPMRAPWFLAAILGLLWCVRRTRGRRA